MAIAYVAGGQATADTGSSTIAATYTAAVSVGALLVAAVVWESDAGTEALNSVSHGTGWTLAPNTYRDATNTESLRMAYFPNYGGGTPTVTATFSTAVGFRRIVLGAWSGAATSSPLDVSTGSSGANTTAANNVTSTAATTTTAGDLIVGGFNDTNNSGGTLSAGTGFTKRSTTAGGFNAYLEDLVQTSAGSIAATSTWSGASRYTAALMAFKAAGSAPAGPGGSFLPYL